MAKIVNNDKGFKVISLSTEDATRYVEDIPIEERNFNYYKEALGL